MPSPKFPATDHLPSAGHEELRQTIQNGLAARKSSATASELKHLFKTLERLESAARNVPQPGIEVYAASACGATHFKDALLAAA